MKIMTKIHNFKFLISTGLIIHVLTHFFNKTFAAVTLCYIMLHIHVSMSSATLSSTALS